MDSAEHEKEKMDSWEKSAWPKMEELKKELEKEFSREPNNLKRQFEFIPYDEKLPEVWQEEIDPDDVKLHVENGNRSCRYLFRFFPKSETLRFARINFINVEVALLRLPEKSLRSRLETVIQSLIESNPGAL